MSLEILTPLNKCTRVARSVDPATFVKTPEVIHYAGTDVGFDAKIKGNARGISILKGLLREIQQEDEAVTPMVKPKPEIPKKKDPQRRLF